MARKLTQEEFINRADEIHNGKYIYDKTIYTSAQSKVIITCPVHGDFEQKACIHLRGCGCPECAGCATGLDKFIEKARKVHGNKYDYSKVEYINANTKVTIICPEHGEFEQTPGSHIYGRGCPKCGKLTTSKKLRSNTDVFIEKAKAIHGNKYDYSKVEYVTQIDEITIICPEHGEFKQRPVLHLQGHGCNECGKEIQAETLRKINELRKITRSRKTQEFIEKARKVHGDFYNYDNVEYINNATKVEIICPKHGSFLQRPSDHLKGHGCIQCKSEKSHDRQAYTLEQWIFKAKEIHGDKYDYNKVEYYNSQGYVTIICPIHGEFEQKANSHLLGYGCPECSKQSRRLTVEKFIKKAKQVHGDRYDYSKVEYYDTKTPVCITCLEHGEFWQTPNIHVSNGSGCPICSESHGETYIRTLLTNYKIPFRRQFCLINEFFKGSKLYIDFFVKYKNKQYFIEYNGKQHYESVEYFGGDEALSKQKNRDQLLRNFCELHKDKVYLLEIPYTMKKEEIKTTILNFIDYEK